MREEILKWWKQAEEDMDTARVNLEGGKFYACAFFCQQALEKALKAVILKKTGNPSDDDMFSHSLIYLGKAAKVPMEYHTFLRELSPQYTLTRYPNLSEETPYELYDETNAGNFLRRTREVISWIKKRLG